MPRSPRHPYRAIAALAAAALAVPAAAPAQPLGPVEDLVVVTATATEEEADDVGATVSVVERTEIRERQARTIAEIVATMGPVQEVQSGGPGQQSSVFLRGAESDQVLVLWNGVPLNSPYFGGFDWASLPTEGVERVEVVAGPYSALYGRDAMGGVVHVITAPEPGVRASFEADDEGSSRAGIAAGRHFERVTVDLTGHVWRWQGAGDNDDFDSEALSGRLRWRPSERVESGLTARWSSTDTGIPRSGGMATPHRTIGREEILLAAPLQVRGDRWQVDGLASRVESDLDFSDPEDPFGFTFSHTDSTADRLRLLGGREGAAWKVAAGAEAERLTATDRSSFGSTLDGEEQSTVAGFVEGRLEGARWAVDGGVRHDDNDAFGTATSPRVGAVVALGRDWLVRGAYGEAFRAPSLGELYFPVTGNPALEPERSESFELGIEWTGGPWRASLVGFETRQDDLIDFDFTTFRNVNVGRARSRGLEAAVARRAPRLDWRIAASLLDAEDLDAGVDLLRRAEETASAVVTWRPAKWSLTAALEHVGERPDVDPVTFARATNPSWTRLDLAAEWELAEWIAATVRIENATDEGYEEALGFPAPGRRFALGARISR